MKYRFKKRPYAHQVVAIKQAVAELGRSGGFALLMEPRTGKTKTTIDIFSILHGMGRVNRVLIVCPIGVIDVWLQEIKDNCPVKHRIVVWDRHGRKTQRLPDWGRDTLDIVIINYDAFSTAPRKRAITRGPRKGQLVPDKSTGRYAMRDKFRAWEPHMIVLDESHRIKSPSSQKTRMIWSLAYKDHKPKDAPAWTETIVPYRMILTGTVYTKKKRIFDIWSQWRFVDRKNKMVKGVSLSDFKERWSVMTERNGYPQWLRNAPDAERKLRKMMHSQAFAVKRSECYDLPEAFPDVILHVDLEPRTARYYDEMVEEMIAELPTGEVVWAKIPLVQRLRLQQITSGIIKTEPTDEHENGRLIRVGKEKLVTLADLAIDLQENDEKFVIGAQFRADIQSIAKLMRQMKIPVYQLHGGISAKRVRGQRSDRDRMIQGFKDRQGCAVMIVQPTTSAEGIDLRSASTMIWYSLTPSWVNFTQFKDRIALSPTAVRYIYLLARGTVDEKQYDVLQEDGESAERMTISPEALRRNFKG